MRIVIRIASSVCLALLAAPAAADMFIYPAKGQSAEQQKKDTFECHQWAVQQTGFDPMTAQPPSMGATEPPPPQQAQQGGVMRGAARGAATGAIVGAIAGDAGKGAAAGAAGGGLIGGMRRNDQRRQQELERQQWQQRQQAQQQQQQNAFQQQRAQFDRAKATCLQGRGYTVS